MNNQNVAGILFFLAGSFVLMGIITAEAMYPPGYSTGYNEISDLGATVPPNSVIYQPSSGIFNTTMLLAGCMVLAATFFIQKHFKKILISIPLCLFGIGLAGIGIFSGDKVPYHGMASMLTFLAGGLSAIVSFKIIAAPFKFIGIVFGSVALVTWMLAAFPPGTLISFIGIGGIERWVAYPIMLWLTGFGGYLMHTKNNAR